MAIHIQDRYIVKKMVSGYMLFVLLFVVLLLLPLCILCKPAVMAKKTHLTVYKGQDVNFLVTTHNPIIYAHFGEAKEGSYHYPFLLVFHVDKSNVVTLATNTSYSSRMEFKGNLTDGQVLFKLSHTQLSDSGEYLIYMKESDKAPDAVTFVLTVKGPLTSTATHTTGSNNWDDNAGSANHTTTLADASLTTGQSTIVNPTIISTINKLKNASLIPDHKNGSLTPDQENGKKLTEVKQHGLKILAVIVFFMLEIVFLIITQIIIEKIGWFRDVRHKKVVPSDCNNTSQAGHQDGWSEGTAVDETKSDINAEAREYQGESPINENKTEAQIEGTSDVEKPEDDEKDALMCDTGVNSVACKLSVSMLGKKCVTDDLSNVIGKSVSISTSNIDSQRDVSNSTIFKEGILDAV